MFGFSKSSSSGNSTTIDTKDIMKSFKDDPKFASTASYQITQLRKALTDIKNNPKILKKPENVAAIAVLGLPLLSILVSNLSNGSRVSAFMMGVSAFSPVFTLLMGSKVIKDRFQTDTNITWTSTSKFPDFLTRIIFGRDTAQLIVGTVAMALIIFTIVSKFSKRKILKSNLTFKYSAYYIAGFTTAMIGGFIAFLYFNKFSLKEAYKSLKAYINFIIDALKDISGSDSKQKYPAMLSILMIFALLSLVFITPQLIGIMLKLGKSKKAIEYVGNKKGPVEKTMRPIDDLKDLDSKDIVKIFNSKTKDIAKIAKSKVKKDINTDNILAILSAVISSKKYINDFNQLTGLFKAVTGSTKPKYIFKMGDVKDSDKVDKLINESMFGRPDVNLNMKDIESEKYKDLVDKLKNMPEVTISDWGSFKIAAAKAMVDVYFKLKEQGYKVNDVYVFLYDKDAHVPPCSLADTVYLGYVPRWFNGLTGSHIEAIIAHELGHIFNVDTMSMMAPLSIIIPGMFFSLLISHFNLSGLDSPVKIMFILSDYIFATTLLEVGRQAEIRADAFAVNLGLTKYLYEALNKVMSGTPLIIDILSEFDEHGSPSKRLKALKAVYEYQRKLKLKN